MKRHPKHNRKLANAQALLGRAILVLLWRGLPAHIQGKGFTIALRYNGDFGVVVRIGQERLSFDPVPLIF